MHLRITVSSAIHDSFRVRQVSGMFDLPVEQVVHETFSAELPDLSETWDIGLIVGPSGSGKTTIARHAFGDALYEPRPWPADRAVIDCIAPESIGIKQITRTLTAVGFSSPPSWLKAYAVLSTGERFRCDLARAILAACPSSFVPGPLQNLRTKDQGPMTPLVGYDEFTSVVDRTVARISSAAISKAIRSRAIPVRFVAVTCHCDVIPWLAPDWVLDMRGPTLTSFDPEALDGRRSLQRPPIELRMSRTDRSTWRLFQRHHYLTGTLHPSAICFLGSVDNEPAAFVAALPFPHPRRPGWREHRAVCLPDFQGVGLGTAASDFVASLFVATGKPYFSRTSHPAMIRHRLHSPLWKMLRSPGMVSRSGRLSRRTTRMADTISRGRNTAGFEYVGPGNVREAMAVGIL